jgi:hypothetical protein
MRSLFLSLLLFLGSFTFASECDDNLTLTKEEIELLSHQVDKYHRIYPGLFLTSKVAGLYLPTLSDMKEKAERGQELTTSELALFEYLSEVLEDFISPAHPNKGLNPSSKRELLQFYDPWDFPF